MPTRPTGVTDTATGTGVVEVDVIERASPDLTTTLTADPGAAGTTLAVTANSKFPSANNYKVRVENEVMLVTSGAGTNSWTVSRAQDGTTGAAHAIGATVSQVVGVQRVEPVQATRQVTFQGLCTTFRTPGRASTAQNLFSIFNASGSTMLVAVRRMTLQVDNTAALLAVTPQVKTARSTTLPTNGTALTKVAVDSNLTSSSNVTLIGDASADGTSSATTLTSTPGTGGWQQMAPRHNTLVGRTEYLDAPLIPTICDTDPIILRASQGLLVNIVAAATTSNPATNFYVVNCFWEEYFAS